MIHHAKFVHTSLVARNWEHLARFYESVFGCRRILPERHFTEEWVAGATGVPHAQIHGIHLRLPGHGDHGPTLEIFQYTPEKEDTGKYINQPGFAHLAFMVDNVEAARDTVVEAGGSILGALTTVPIPQAGTITFIYLADPEGNILELQKWDQI